MSYSSLTSTQFVSRNNLQDAVNTAVITLNAGQTIPTGNRFVTKQDVLTYTNIDSNNIFLSPKTNLQLIAKRDITPIVISTFNYSFTTSPGGEFVITNNNTSTVVLLLSADGTGTYTFVSGNSYTIEVIGSTQTSLFINNNTTSTILYNETVSNPAPNSFTFTPTTNSYTIVASSN
jgi:hypothetical protein